MVFPVIVFFFFLTRFEPAFSLQRSRRRFLFNDLTYFPLSIYQILLYKTISRLIIRILITTFSSSENIMCFQKPSTEKRIDDLKKKKKIKSHLTKLLFTKHKSTKHINNRPFTQQASCLPGMTQNGTISLEILIIFMYACIFFIQPMPCNNHLQIKHHH